MAGWDTARTGRALAVVALVALTAAPALADSVPLPRPRPHRVLYTGSVPSLPPAALRARAQATAAQAAPAQQPQPAPNPVSNPFAALLGKPGSTTALTPEQRSIIERVDTYLSTVQTLTGKFVQIGPDGGRSTGLFYLSKPGRVRFEYDSPNPTELVADGQSVVVRDRNLGTQDVYPLSQTPLRFLLADHVDLMKDTNLVAVYADDVFVTVVVEEKNALVGTSRLMIMFDAKDMQLKQWTVTDPQGYDTTVAVYNLDSSKKLNPSMFRIDYTNYHN
ncbi:MAG TPA: outer membrane lipoprotein carrier protein LolA [Pseudolabrys sp.]|uniref:outer membrane lipoprotein carrier protein LolA n=1 Tax=Pseudolabrys sp. TaxID=1960880 RepID=UPI002DDCF43D|nr:outer membrane lipoprotein carrier protein LolA [Pseudolabrys sp.]HEV2628119.1 outer membrane lipoprotein carrier protein LolA [Pseudolabrys sp.]